MEITRLPWKAQSPGMDVYSVTVLADPKMMATIIIKKTGKPAIAATTLFGQTTLVAR